MMLAICVNDGSSVGAHVLDEDEKNTLISRSETDKESLTDNINKHSIEDESDQTNWAIVSRSYRLEPCRHIVDLYFKQFCVTTNDLNIIDEQIKIGVLFRCNAVNKNENRSMGNHPCKYLDKDITTVEGEKDAPTSNIYSNREDSKGKHKGGVLISNQINNNLLDTSDSFVREFIIASILNENNIQNE